MEERKILRIIMTLLLADLLTIAMSVNATNAAENAVQFELLKRYDGQAVQTMYWGDEITTVDSPPTYILPGPYPYEFSTTIPSYCVLKIRQALWVRSAEEPNTLDILLDGRIVFSATAIWDNSVDGGPTGEPYSIDLGFLASGLHSIEMRQTYDLYYLIDWWEVWSKPAPLSIVAVSPVDNVAGPGESFSIDVTIANVLGTIPDVYSYQVKLGIDKNILYAVSVVEGSFLSDWAYSWGMSTVFVYITHPDYVYVACSMVGVCPGASGYNGTLFTVTFNVKAPGVSDLDIYGSIIMSCDGATPPVAHYPPEFVEQDGSFHTTLPATLAATVDVDPDSLNLKSKGKWTTAYIQLHEGYSAADVDASTILLNGTIQPVLDPKYGFVTNPNEYLIDHNNDGILERMLKFDRASLASWIYQSVGMQSDVSLTMTGKLLDGTSFEGTDTISAFWIGKRSPCKL